MRWLPNSISISRLLLIIPYLWLFLYSPQYKWWTLCLAVIIVLTDKLDGIAARRFHCESKKGELLDSVADMSFTVLSWVFFYIKDLYAMQILILILLPRLLMGFSLIAYRLVRNTWNFSHFMGNKIHGVANFIAIIWLLADFPYSLPVLWIMIGINYAAAASAELERHKFLSISNI